MKNKITSGEISSGIPRHLSPERKKYIEDKIKEEQKKLEAEKAENK